MINAQQLRIIHHYKNTTKLFKTTAAVWFNKIRRFNHLQPEYTHIKLTAVMRKELRKYCTHTLQSSAFCGVTWLIYLTVVSKFQAEGQPLVGRPRLHVQYILRRNIFLKLRYNDNIYVPSAAWC